jgi:hypothetical protein
MLAVKQVLINIKLNLRATNFPERQKSGLTPLLMKSEESRAGSEESRAGSLKKTEVLHASLLK